MDVRRARGRDVLMAALAVTLSAASLVLMVVVVRSGRRSAFELVVEVATWVAATLGVAVVPWRRTIWGCPNRRADSRRPCLRHDHGR